MLNRLPRALPQNVIGIKVMAVPDDCFQKLRQGVGEPPAVAG
jgi:hypothetical protein